MILRTAILHVDYNDDPGDSQPSEKLVKSSRLVTGVGLMLCACWLPKLEEQPDGSQGEAGRGGAASDTAGQGGQTGCPECDGECVDLQTDPKHCGTCGHECGDQHVANVRCVGGECRPTCQENYGDCSQPGAAEADDGCETNLEQTAEHCGDCNAACTPPHSCHRGVCEGPSCANLEGCDEESCCLSLVVPGGRLAMGRSNNGDDADPDGQPDEQDATDSPEHEVTVSTFYLDKHEVTVGRFRSFVECVTEGTCGDWRPTPGAGANESVQASHSDYDTGWDTSWSLPTSEEEWDEVLSCDDALETWTTDEGGDETLAINCVSWYEAMAFCIWDGGYLPTEAEWEYAAAGGDENRLFPWGSSMPGEDCTLANWVSCEHGGVGSVGLFPGGAGRWGHRNLAGNVSEWVFDWYAADWYDRSEASGENPCNAADSSTPSERSMRGGDFTDSVQYLRAADRNFYDPGAHHSNLGFRCARVY